MKIPHAILDRLQSIATTAVAAQNAKTVKDLRDLLEDLSMDATTAYALADELPDD